MLIPQQSFQTKPTSVYQSLNPEFNPDLNLFFPQPVPPSEVPYSGTVLNPPPATVPHGSPASNTSNFGGFERQPLISDDPNSGTGSWVVQHPDSITHAIAIDSLHEKSMVSTGLCTPGNNVLTNQSLVKNATKTVPRKTKVIQPIRCGVCNIDCNSNDVYEKHISGKKHKKKSEMHNSSTATVIGDSNAAAGENLETKRQKLVEGGATVVFMRVCTMCNVVCNSQEVFDKHLAGKKHVAQARKHPQDGMEPSVDTNPNDISGIIPTVLPRDHSTGQCETDPNKTRFDQFAWCEVCSIYCSCNDSLIAHKLGKKHLRNLEKLRKIETDTSTPAPTDAPVTAIPVTGPMEEVNHSETDKFKNEIAAESQAPQDDSKTKKQKIIECKADGIEQCVAANPDSASGTSPMVSSQAGCESDPNKTSADKFAWCGVSNSYCASNNAHVTSINAAVTMVTVPGPMKNPEVSWGETDESNNENAAKSQALREDSGTKKRKIMEGGEDVIEQSVAANSDFVGGISPRVLPRDNKNGACESNPNKTTADQFAKCEVCNIYCSNTDDLIIHKLGKKHLKNLDKLKKAEADTSAAASANAPDLSVPETRPVENLEANKDKTKELKNKNATETQAPKEDLETKKRKIMEVGAARDAVRECTMCNVVCNSQTVLDSHLAGQKHAAASANAPVMSVPGTQPVENLEANKDKTKELKNKNATESHAPKEDLETKKRKIMEVGAARDAVRECTMCNVVCNSQTVLDSHLAGQKHATMARKQAAVGFTLTTGSQFVAATKDDER